MQEFGVICHSAHQVRQMENDKAQCLIKEAMPFCPLWCESSEMVIMLVPSSSYHCGTRRFLYQPHLSFHAILVCVFV